MSRCFPFPPPGYEKKSRSDDADLLNKEKQRERKRKKEKDKEKKVDKEKEKDRRDGKHRDRKDKNREKKKEKERDKDIDKKTPSDEKRLAVQSDSLNGARLHKKENERDEDKDKNGISDEKKQTLQFQGRSGDRPIPTSIFTEGNGDYKFVQELWKRIRDEGRTRSQLVDRLPVTEQKNDERNRVVVKDARILSGGKEKNNEKGDDNRKIDGFVSICSDSAVVQNFVGLAQNRVEDIPGSSGKQIERQIEEKEKSKEREGCEKRREKRKDKDKEKKSHGKDKEREKETKKEEKMREKSRHKTENGGKLKDSSKNDQVCTLNVIYTYGAKDGDMNTAIEGILEKRKDLEANGFLHAADVRPNKKPRPSPHMPTENGRKLDPSHTAILFASDDTDIMPIKLPKFSPHPLVENGRKLGPSQSPIHLTFDRQAPPNNLKLNNKEIKVNGLIKSHPLPISSKNSLFPTEKIAQASTKPPHPDSKYLSQVLSVPKMEELSDFDDLEWLLFNGKDCSAKKKPNVGSSESPRVWAEAVQIESADVCALPYVIPY